MKAEEQKWHSISEFWIRDIIWNLLSRKKKNPTQSYEIVFWHSWGVLIGFSTLVSFYSYLFFLAKQLCIFSFTVTNLVGWKSNECSKGILTYLWCLDAPINFYHPIHLKKTKEIKKNQANSAKTKQKQKSKQNKLKTNKQNL